MVFHEYVVQNNIVLPFCWNHRKQGARHIPRTEDINTTSLSTDNSYNPIHSLSIYQKISSHQSLQDWAAFPHFKMKFHIWGLAALAGVSSACVKDWRCYECEWDGSSPSCGETKHYLGEKVGDKYLAAWTRDMSKDGLKALGGLGSCSSEYGNTCWSGYKRLWCK